MKNFKEFSEKYPDSAKDLLEMSKEEILEQYAIEVSEKDELAEYKSNNEFFETDLEHIINLGIKWLKRNKKSNHHIYIKDGKSKLIYTNIEETWI